MDKDRIKKEARVYLEESETVAEAAQKCGVCLRTFQLHLKSLKEIDLTLHNLVLAKQAKNQKAGRAKGSRIGKRTVTYTKEEAIELAQLIITYQLTYKEAEEATGIPTSTIYDMVHNSTFISEEMQAKLAIVAEANNRAMTTEEYRESREIPPEPLDLPPMPPKPPESRRVK